MNERRHPDHVLLNAYAHQPDADDFRQVSLHLLRCKECRDQVNLSNQIKTGFTSLHSEPCSDEQQRTVDDFLYNENSDQHQQQLKQQIRSDPQMLKSVLFSLSHRAQQKESLTVSQPLKSHKPSRNWIGMINEWLQLQSSTWATMSITAVVTLALTIFMLQQHSFDPDAGAGIRIASYQDNNVIRFFPREQLPGIGFFSGAKHSSLPFQNIRISTNEKQMLELSWEPVKSASAYELNLFRFTKGEKKLLETFKTTDILIHYQLGIEDYSQRFEWVLSGNTTDDKNFITTGGFIVQKPSNRGDL